ncbi:putative fatty acyl-CoA reductase CG5065 [Anoplophora glabripennis]|uniref:putative fatty acyl-CoA reductase CG5065 n=1 Tax=Anoplophora glabripennis TaxID=217634 RepID=UPI000C787637|nr:putative fatty acyl-CoA reductase CG5065 [Anoplophora glabripennis]
MAVGDYFNGKYIFITGGSGFIGKVLIEKLLRSCVGIEKVYLLLRGKKGKTAEERLNDILNNHLFDTLKKFNPAAIQKLVPICGDVMEPGLGLSEKDTQTLIENVDIIYHGAASIRFDDHLKDSVLLNTRGTKEVIDIALQARKLITFVHISTAYCNCDRFEVEEKLYPAHADWKTTISLAEQVDQHTLNILSPHFIHPLPNTYSFAKSLSEHVVTDLCKGKMRTAIARPSIVIPALDDPIAGWVDNFNGPLGILCAAGKGIMKITYAGEEVMSDCIPVDIFVKFLILITYERALSKDLHEVSIYNTTAGEDFCIRLNYISEISSKIIWDGPYTNLFWYPSYSMTNNWYKYYVTFLLCHMLPALIFDGLLKLVGKNPIMTKIQRKVYLANMALKYFMQHTFKFKNASSMALHRHLEESEMERFSFIHYLGFNEEYAYYLNTKIATSTLFNEKFNRKKGFRNTMILWILDRILRITIFGVLCWYLITKMKIATIFNNMADSFICYLNQL